MNKEDREGLALLDRIYVYYYSQKIHPSR